MSFSSGPATVTSTSDAREDGDAYSLIDAHSTLDGTLVTRRDLLVEGQVSGTVRCEGTLYVAEGSAIDATIDAANIVVSGTMSGTIRCHGLLEIRDTGVVRGEVDTARLTILEGAVYEGHIRMQPGEMSAPTPDSITVGADQTEAPPSNAAASYSFLRTFSASPPNESSSPDDLPGGDIPEDPDV